MIDRDAIRKIKQMEHNSIRCLKAFYYYELLSDNKMSQDFLSYSQNLYGEEVILRWCHFFKKKTDTLYHLKLFGNPTVCKMGIEYRQEAVKKRIFESTNLSKEEFEQYCNHLFKIRDKFKAHIDPCIMSWPEITICKKMVEELRSVIKELTQCCLEEMPNESSQKYHTLQDIMQNIKWEANEDLERYCRNSAVRSFRDYKIN